MVTAEKTKRKLDIFLSIVALFFMLLGLYANVRYNSADILLRFVVGLVLTAFILALLSQTSYGRSVFAFAKESQAELKRMVWPNREETVKVTVMVIALVVIIALIIWGIDIVFLNFVGWLTGQKV